MSVGRSAPEVLVRKAKTERTVRMDKSIEGQNEASERRTKMGETR
jgi:hypothetical protein